VTGRSRICKADEVKWINSKLAGREGLDARSDRFQPATEFLAGTTLCILRSYMDRERRVGERP